MHFKIIEKMYGKYGQFIDLFFTMMDKEQTSQILAVHRRMVLKRKLKILTVTLWELSEIRVVYHVHVCKSVRLM